MNQSVHMVVLHQPEVQVVAALSRLGKEVGRGCFPTSLRLAVPHSSPDSQPALYLRLFTRLLIKGLLGGGLEPRTEIQSPSAISAWARLPHLLHPRAPSQSFTPPIFSHLFSLSFHCDEKYFAQYLWLVLYFNFKSRLEGIMGEVF